MCWALVTKLVTGTRCAGVMRIATTVALRHRSKLTWMHIARDISHPFRIDRKEVNHFYALMFIRTQREHPPWQFSCHSPLAWTIIGCRLTRDNTYLHILLRGLRGYASKWCHVSACIQLLFTQKESADLIARVAFLFVSEWTLEHKAHTRKFSIGCLSIRWS